MMNIMFRIPSDAKIEKCIITKACVEGTEEPLYIFNDNRPILNKKAAKMKKMPPKDVTAKKNA
jgi:ATP-dependent protease Clp ATPase subunit